MRRIGTVLLFLGSSLLARAETSLDVLDRDLHDIATERQATTSATLANFLAQLTAAAASPEAALALYQQAGGEMPLPTPVASDHVNETISERDARGVADQAAMGALAGGIQMQAGLMKQAALIVLRPDDATVQAAYVAWLKTAALSYPAMMQNVSALDPVPPSPDPETAPATPRRHRRFISTSTNVARRLTEMSLHVSPLGTYLGFTQWGTSIQGTWRVRDVPANYRAEVLEPQRTALSPGVLTTWDTYIAMRVADGAETDELTFLAFLRAGDAFSLSPTVDKLSAAVALIRNNPTNSHSGEMIQRAQAMLAACKQRYEPAQNVPPPIAPGPATPVATPPIAETPGATPRPESEAAPQPDPPAPPKQP